MIILGIDPGLRKTGYGFLEKKGSNYSIIKLGTIILDTKKTTHFRLWQLFDTFSQLITEVKPDCMAIERVFTSKNIRSAFLIGEARAACIISAVSNGVDIFEYATRAVKQGITGYGDAGKEDVQKMVRLILKYNGKLEEDAADALALAIFHGNISEVKGYLK